MENKATEAQKYVWEGAIPLQIHLHESEVTTLPPPAPALILAPRIGYLPLLVPQLKPLFSSIVPPGVDTVWFDYKGLPLRWYIPTGVLFDLLCAEPERPWNLTVHFRGYPEHVLTPCEGEDSVKWSFINSLKEAACIITGNSKNVMNMSQSDQAELWRSVLNGNLETYLGISSKLKLDFSGDDFCIKVASHYSKSRQSGDDADHKGTDKPGRIPVRLYVRISNEDFDDIEEAPTVETWDRVSYINRPAEILHGDDKFTLFDAMKALLPEFFVDKSRTKYAADVEVEEVVEEEEEGGLPPTGEGRCDGDPIDWTSVSKGGGEIKVIRIQGIEPKLDIPFAWIVNNLMNPDHFLHISAFVNTSGSI